MEMAAKKLKENKTEFKNLGKEVDELKVKLDEVKEHKVIFIDFFRISF